MSANKKTKSGDFTSDESPSKQMPIRHSPRKKPGGFDMLISAARVADEQEGQMQQVQHEVEAKPAVADKPQKLKVKWTLKQLQSQSELHLQALLTLSAKYLRILFSEAEQGNNMYSNHFEYRCKFYPEGEGTCNETFSSYKDESSVFSQLEKHMTEHLKKEKENNEDFVTTSVQYRRKQKEGNKKKTCGSASSKKGKSSSLKRGSPDPEAVGDQSSDHSNDSTRRANKRKSSSQDDKENHPQTSSSDSLSASQREEENPEPSKRPRTTSTEDQVSEKHDRELEEEGTVWSFPYPDHTYAAPAGGRPKEGRRSPVSEGDSEDASVASEMYSQEKPVSPSSPAQPANTKLPLDVFPVATHEETIPATVQDMVESKGGVVKKEAANNTTVRKRVTPKRKVPAISNEQKEQAEKHIHDLQNRKKDEDFKLVCLMCNDGKVFTAGATLLNHYKSHAGLKPFTCTKCGSTFTRKHSLKYHKLIHDGTSRFMCSTCHKHFRHPSHFKEHQRKHTGETPYVCEFCLQRYKTRNTYKRHLRTHHGKILTVKGVTSMTEEEFAKVRTKKYKKTIKSEVSTPDASPVSSTNPSPEPVIEDQKRSRKVTKKSTVAPSKPAATQTSTVTQSTPVTLPPVGSILMTQYVPHSQVSSGITSVLPQSFMHVSSPQASVGVLPPMASMGVIGMSVRPSTIVYSNPTGLPLVHQPPFVTNPSTVTMGQPAMIVTNPSSVTMGQPSTTAPSGLPSHTYYPSSLLALTAFSPVTVPVETTQAPENRHGSEVDMSDYKAVGYVTHNL